MTPKLFQEAHLLSTPRLILGFIYLFIVYIYYFQNCPIINFPNSKSTPTWLTSYHIGTQIPPLLLLPPKPDNVQKGRGYG